MSSMIKLKELVLSLVIPLGVGYLSSLLTQNAAEYYECLSLPMGAPPAWVFPVVWTILYLLMGIACYLILISAQPIEVKNFAISLYAMQLVLNFLWPIIFFRFQLMGLAMITLILLIVLIVLTAYSFYKINKIAGYLMIPYLIWCIYALYLSYGIG